MPAKESRTLSSSTEQRRPAWHGYAAWVLGGWLILGAAGLYIASVRKFPLSAAVPVLAAFLLEYAFYILPGFTRFREYLVDRIPIMAYAGLLAASALLPYLVASLGGGFDANGFVRLVVIALVFAYWYVFRRPSMSSDLAIVALFGAFMLASVFRQIYVFPIEERVDILGKLMLIRLFITVMLTIREVDGTGFTFLPSGREWKIGFRYFVLFAPLGFGAATLAGLLRFEPTAKSLAFAPLQFLGALWVIALFEEFLFRGLIQKWFAEYTRRPWIALVVTSIIFGLSHLPFGEFPNWDFAIVAGVAGLFYGRAFQENGGVGASMAAHALTVTLWRAFFRN